MSQWKLVTYQSPTGKLPVKKFIESLDLTAQSKIRHLLNMLKELGIQFGLPHAKKLSGTDIWELRVLGKDNIRIFYAAIERKKFILLHGFKKKSNKTPFKELKIAIDRLSESKLRE